jgi:hypothetical protein
MQQRWSKPCTHALVLLIGILSACKDTQPSRLTSYEVESVCADSGGAPPNVVHRDSGSVKIVENRIPADTLAQASQLREAATIGVDDDNRGGGVYALAHTAGQMFPGIAHGVIRMPSGEIVVADDYVRELRVFDPRGEYVRSIGRQGEGPGEFRGILSIFRGADTIFVAESGRITLFDVSGAVLRIQTLESQVPTQTSVAGQKYEGAVRPVLIGKLNDGSLIGVSRRFILDTSPPPGELIQRGNRTFGIVRFQPDGTLIDTLPEIAKNQAYSYSIIISGVGHTFSDFLPYGGGAIAVHGDHIAYVDARRAEVIERGKDGVIFRKIRVCGAPRPLDNSDIAAFGKIFAARRAEKDKKMYADIFSRISHPADRPWYQAVLYDDGDRIWVQEFAFDSESKRWQVFSAEGNWLKTIVTPPGVNIEQVGQNYVLGRQSDSLGVEQVRLYTIR